MNNRKVLFFYILGYFVIIFEVDYTLIGEWQDFVNQTPGILYFRLLQA